MHGSTFAELHDVAAQPVAGTALFNAVPFDYLAGTLLRTIPVECERAVHAPNRAASHLLLPSGCLPVHQIPAERVLVVYDDLDLATAAVRLRAKGGHGGHNGMKSIAGRAVGCRTWRPAALWTQPAARRCVAILLYICEWLAYCCSPDTHCLRCGTTVKGIGIPLPSRACPGPQPTFKVLRTSLGCALASAARPAPCPSTPGCCRWASVAAYCLELWAPASEAQLAIPAWRGAGCMASVLPPLLPRAPPVLPRPAGLQQGRKGGD